MDDHETEFDDERYEKLHTLFYNAEVERGGLGKRFRALVVRAAAEHDREGGTAGEARLAAIVERYCALIEGDAELRSEMNRCTAVADVQAAAIEDGWTYDAETGTVTLPPA